MQDLQNGVSDYFEKEKEFIRNLNRDVLLSGEINNAFWVNTDTDAKSEQTSRDRI